jgi:hypothetical protein
MLTPDAVTDGDRPVEQNANGRDVNQAGRDIIYHLYRDANPPDDEDDDSSEDGGGGGFWIVAVIVVVAMIGLITKCGGAGAGDSDGPFPKKTDPWPAGASRPAIMVPVVSKIQACAEVRVLNPVNCPQKVPGVDGDISKVNWSLEGDPGDGAVIRYHAGRFDVIGHAVMTVVYNAYDGPAFTLRKVNYRASVPWNNGAVVVNSIGNTTVNPKPPIVKRNPQLSLSQITPSLREAFKHCTSVHVAPLPDDCPTPHDKAVVPSNNAKWTLDGDPLLNAQSSFDGEWGLTHITGSYAMTVHYSDLFGSHTQEQNGTYDAAISADGSIVRVLRIAG